MTKCFCVFAFKNGFNLSFVVCGVFALIFLVLASLFLIPFFIHEVKNIITIKYLENEISKQSFWVNYFEEKEDVFDIPEWKVI